MALSNVLRQNATWYNVNESRYGRPPPRRYPVTGIRLWASGSPRFSRKWRLLRGSPWGLEPIGGWWYHLAPGVRLARLGRDLGRDERGALARVSARRRGVGRRAGRHSPLGRWRDELEQRASAGASAVHLVPGAIARF